MAREEHEAVFIEPSGSGRQLPARQQGRCSRRLSCKSDSGRISVRRRRNPQVTSKTLTGKRIERPHLFVEDEADACDGLALVAHPAMHSAQTCSASCSSLHHPTGPPPLATAPTSALAMAAVAPASSLARSTRSGGSG